MKKLSATFLMLLIGFSSYAQWNQLGTDIDGEANSDQSGGSVSVSADGLTVAIGAVMNDAVGNNAGHVRVYQYNGTNWAQKGLDIDGEVVGDQSGFSVSMSANGLTVAIGAQFNDGAATNAGHVRVYQYNGTNWIQQGIDIDGEAGGDYSGYSVSMSANGLTVAISAYANDGNGSSSGHVRVYDWNGTFWIQKGVDIDGEAVGDQLGASVSMSSDGLTFAVGARGNDGGGNGSGHVRVYSWNGTSWVQKGLDIDGEAILDQSGASVSMSGNGLSVAIGAMTNDGGGSDAGHVRVFQYNGTSWVQQGSDIDGEAAGDNSGGSVSMSVDGLTVAIGAAQNDGAGINAGHVRVYKYDGINWIQQGIDIDGEAASDASGSSISVSADGLIVAVGARLNNGSGIAVGHVRLYSFCIPASSTDVQTACDSYTWIDGTTYNSSTSTPTFNIVGGAANGCDSLVTLNLTINNSVTGTDVQTACGSYTWLDGNTYNLSINTPTFNIANGAANGCDSLVTLDLTITPLPDNTNSVAGLTITANQAGATYQWIDCNNGNSSIVGETNANYTATANGDYAVIVTMNSCSDTSACVNISTVGVNENAIVNQVSISPNPTKRNVEFQLGKLKDVSIQVFSLTGKLVYQESNINTSSHQLTLNNAPGFYIVNLTSNGESQQFKLIKE